MSELYRVRWRLGKTEIEVESSDQSYVDAKVAELIETFTSKKGKTKAEAKSKPKADKPKAEAKKAEAKKADKPKAEAKKAEAKKADKPKAEAKKAEAKKAEAKKAEAKKADKKAEAKKPAKKAEAKKADKPKAEAKTAKKAAKPKSKAKARSKAATKRKATTKAKSKPAAKARPQAVTADDLAGQIKNHAGFSQIDASILKKPGQLPRVLLCHYFANKLGLAQGLTAHQVESITNELGVRIASPNVAKVIRQKGKKYFSSSRNNGVTVYRINNSGLTAVEQIVSS